MSNENLSAFPCQPLNGNGEPFEAMQPGLSKREYFAAMAMQAMIPKDEVTHAAISLTAKAMGKNEGEVVVMAAVEFANALLAELAKGDK